MEGQFVQAVLCAAARAERGIETDIVQRRQSFDEQGKNVRALQRQREGQAQSGRRGQRRGR